MLSIKRSSIPQIQNVLERTDLTVDERIKLYDQNLLKYINLYDDYRPTTKTVKVEPNIPVKTESTKQKEEGGHDKDVIDSVPKTLNGKAELES